MYKPLKNRGRFLIKECTRTSRPPAGNAKCGLAALCLMAGAGGGDVIQRTTASAHPSLSAALAARRAGRGLRNGSAQEPGSKVPVYTLEANRLSISPARPQSCETPLRRHTSVTWTQTRRPFTGDRQLYRHTLVIRNLDLLPPQILTNHLDFSRLIDRK